MKSICINGHTLTDNNVRIVRRKNRPDERICVPCKTNRDKDYLKTDNGVIHNRIGSKKYANTITGKINATRRKEIYLNTALGALKEMNRIFIYNSKRNGTLKIKNICIECGSKGYTEIHHDKYHDPPKLIDIRELCSLCHDKEKQ